MATDKKKSILIIDDEEDILSTLTSIITGFEYTAVCAQTLPAALIKVNNQAFNVILLDVRLKHDSGLKVVDQIRRNHMSMNHETPLILHSGNIDPDLIDRYRMDIDDALVKPASIDTIRNKLQLWDSKKHIKNTISPMLSINYGHRKVSQK